jgi:hypothetical protein
VNFNLSKRFWLLALAATVMAAGCGGSGGGDDDDGGNNPPPVNNVTRVNLPTTSTPVGRFTVSYLPRQGRATDVVSATISDLILRKGFEDIFQIDIPTPISFVLNGSEVQNYSTLVDIPKNEDLRVFDTFELLLQNVTYSPADGFPAFYSLGDEPLISQAFQARIKVYRGREANVDIRLNDASLEFFFNEDGSPSLEPPLFRADLFEAANLRDGVIQSYLSDLMMFDISGMPAGSRPNLSSGPIADRIYFSGDRIALSNSATKNLEMISPEAGDPIPGVYADPIILGNGTTPGEFRLLVPDPNDPSEVPAQITALRGMFRPFYNPAQPTISLIIPASGNTFDAIILPTSRGTDVFQILLIAHDGQGHVSNIYFGDADFSARSFVAYPIVNVTTGSTSNRIQGTIQNYTNRFGAVVNVASPDEAEDVFRGTFALTSAPPSGLPSAGTFVVFR